MERDWQAVIRSLRVKAADSAVGPDESTALTAKADELAGKYGEARQSLPPQAVFGYTKTYTGFDSFLKDFDSFLVDAVKSAARSPQTTEAYATWLDGLYDDGDDQSWAVPS